MPFALTQLLVHKVPILLPCLATVNFISDSLIKDWQHANPLDIKCIFLLLSFGFRSFERSLNGICLYFITMSLPFVQLRTPVSLSTLLSAERALPHAAPQGWRRDYLAALKDLNCCKNIPNPKCKTYSGWQWIFVLKEKFPISNLLGRWHKSAALNSIPWITTAKYNFTECGCSDSRVTQPPYVEAQAVAAESHGRINVPSPLCFCHSLHIPLAQDFCALFFLLRGAQCFFPHARNFLMSRSTTILFDCPFCLVDILFRLLTFQNSTEKSSNSCSCNTSIL